MLVGWGLVGQQSPQSCGNRSAQQTFPFGLLFHEPNYSKKAAKQRADDNVFVQKQATERVVVVQRHGKKGGGDMGARLTMSQSNGKWLNRCNKFIGFSLFN